MNNIVKTLSVITLFALTAVANAIPVSYTESAPQTAAGQVFNFEYNPILDSTGEGSLYIKARGDYSVAWPAIENLGFNIDGVFTGIAAPQYGNVINTYSYDDVLFEIEFTIGESLMDEITESLSAVLVLDLASDVNIVTANSFVEATLSYEGVSNEVPEPAILFILGAGLLGFAGIKRRR